MSVNYNKGRKEVLTRTPVIEQAMSWLIKNGPLVLGPDLPLWTLKNLSKSGRIVHLYRDAYVAPQKNGQMPFPEEILTQLEPNGYLSFSAALKYHRLTDQPTSQFVTVTNKCRRPIKYLGRSLYFFTSEKSLASAQTIDVQIGKTQIRMATPEQAIFDSLNNRNLGADSIEILNAIQLLITADQSAKDRLIKMALSKGNAAVAQRLGYLLDLSIKSLPQELLVLARSGRHYVVLDNGIARITDKTWRVKTKMGRNALQHEGLEIAY